MAEFGVEETRMRLQEIVDRSIMGEKITVSTERGNAVIVCEEDWDSLIKIVSGLASRGALGAAGSPAAF